MATAKPLTPYMDYSRLEVHDALAPESNFTPQAGTWGLQGIVEYSPREFVFFVTFGSTQGDHTFDEGITSEGVLSWQSQPKQKLGTPQIRRLIEHDEELHSVHLLLRTDEAGAQGVRRPYSYLGTLKYLNHDSEREEPVHFQWQLLSWPAPPAFLQRIGLRLMPSPEGSVPPGVVSHDGVLVERPPPEKRSARAGLPTRTFQSRKSPDYAERDAANRDLGLAGERAVVRYEADRLRKLGRGDLAERVVHLSSSQGDGAGYDVSSFDASGEPLFIEVKTTRGPAETDFFMSANEVAAAKAHAGHYALYRVFDFDPLTGSASFYVVPGPVEPKLTLTPVQFRVRLA
jgi:hypothetical protein